MIRRTMEAARLNEIVNHPDVRPFIGGGDGALDLTEVAANPLNIVLEAEHGFWLLTKLDPGTYELHTCFLKEGRGPSYFRLAREALRYVFTRSDATEILTKCPDDNPGAVMAALKVGFRERFHRDNAWAPDVGIGFYAFTIDDWMMRDAEALKAGEEFHAALETALGHENHPDDKAHNRAAGAAVLLMREGMIAKGVGLYNRWAMFAGYAPISQVGTHLIDIQTAVIEAVGREMNIVLLRG